jgi:phosphoglycerate dehydrogenase-like enzyme
MGRDVAVTGAPSRDRPRIVVLDALFPDIELERSLAETRGWSLSAWDGDPASLEGAVAVVHVRTRVDRALMERVPSLRVVGRYGTGLDSVDLEAAADLGIAAVGIRDYCVPELTSHTLGLAFALDRRISAAASGRLGPDVTWHEVSAGQPIPGRTTATVIGFGTIGRAVTRALLACGLSVRVVTRHGADDARRIGSSPVSLDDGLADAGFVFLHTALSTDTAALVDASRIERMSSDAILVDTARLGLIDERAVADALSSGRLAGVAIDARLAHDSPLRGLLGDPRLLVTPHIGWYSERSAVELRRRTIEETIDAAQAA